mgnify:CR=1 FL=1
MKSVEFTRETVRLTVLYRGCVGVPENDRTASRGGIVVLPVGEEINTFTPVQHPANDMTTATVTTHF